MNVLNGIGTLKGIGDKREQLFHAKGIYTIQDLLFYIPKSFKDYSKITPITEASNLDALMYVTVLSTPKLSFYKGKSLVRAKIKDHTTEAEIMFFNMPYMRDQIKSEESLYLYGRVSQKDGRYRIINPSFERNAETIKQFPFVPVYSQIHGISQHMLIKTIQAVLTELKDERDYLSDAFKAELGLPEIYLAHRSIHFPDQIDKNKSALRRFSIEELLVFLCMLDTQAAVKQNTDVRLTVTNAQQQAFLKSAGFSPTNAQRRVMQEIAFDLSSGKVMNRLIQGDVGCGKTLAAFYAMFINAASGYQSVMMAPTEVLARQHYLDAIQFFEPLGITTVLVTGSDTANQRKDTLEVIKSGKADIVIGTHALIYGDIIYFALNLAITDEQHRFGVAQRAKLSEKSQLNMLVMSATPIPRTLALVLYSDMDVSVIDEMPAGRQPVDTFLVREGKRAEMYVFIRDQIEKGRQAYVVCPLIDGDEEDTTVQSIYNEITKTFSGIQAAKLYGRMASAEKAETMARFAQGQIDILVSTTVIEVGVNVPNSTVMVVEGAERFGLSTLHQLRGRVGRGSEQSYCFLVCEKTTERLEVLKEENDGFIIAEKDLEIRGPGQFLGYSQHGVSDFYMSRMIQDMASLNLAKSIMKRMKAGEFQKEYEMAKRMARKKYENLKQDIAMN